MAGAGPNQKRSMRLSRIVDDIFRPSGVVPRKTNRKSSHTSRIPRTDKTMTPPRNPARVDCRCGCLGVREYHEAGERVRLEMLGVRATAAREPVKIGKKTTRPGFGLKPAEIGLVAV
jgi:hypothetical protein